MTIYIGRTKRVPGTTEGAGSLFQWDIMLKYIANALGIEHYHSGYDNISHYQYTEFDKEEWNESFNKFFNFKKIDFNPDATFVFERIDDDFLEFVKKYKTSNEKYVVDIRDEKSIEAFCIQNSNLIFSEKNIINFRSLLNYNGKEYYDNNINVAVHLRSINKQDVDFQPVREYYDAIEHNIRYLNLIRFINQKFSNRTVNIHIYSQGDKKRFVDLLNYESDRIKFIFHINTNPVEDLYHMAHADILFMANSAFSYLAALMNPNVIFVRNNFWQFVPPNSIKLDFKYDNIL